MIFLTACEMNIVLTDFRMTRCDLTIGYLRRSFSFLKVCSRVILSLSSLSYWQRLNCTVKIFLSDILAHLLSNISRRRHLFLFGAVLKPLTSSRIALFTCLTISLRHSFFIFWCCTMRSSKVNESTPD